MILPRSSEVIPGFVVCSNSFLASKGCKCGVEFQSKNVLENFHKTDNIRMGTMEYII